MPNPLGTIASVNISEFKGEKKRRIGKECHARCAVFTQAGECVMPREGVFTEVLEGGQIKVGDSIEVLA